MELLRATDIRLKKDVYALFEKAIKTMFEDGYHIEQADGSDIRFSNGDDVVRLSIKNGDAIPTCFKNEYVSPLVVSAQSFSNNTAPQPTADDAVARTFFIYKDAACSSVKAWEHMRGVAIERRKSGQTSEIRVMHPSGKKWNEFLRSHNCDPKSVKSVTVSKVVKADEKDGVLREYLTVEVAKKGRKALPITKTGLLETTFCISVKICSFVIAKIFLFNMPYTILQLNHLLHQLFEIQRLPVYETHLHLIVVRLISRRQFFTWHNLNIGR
jgi:hypothetical protein